MIITNNVLYIIKINLELYILFMELTYYLSVYFSFGYYILVSLLILFITWI